MEDPLQRSVAPIIHARFLSDCGQYDEALRVLEAVHLERQNTLGPDHPATVSTVYRIGLVHLRQQNLSQARAIFEGILQVHGRDDEVWVWLIYLVRMSLALAQLERGDVAQALPALQHGFDHYCASDQIARQAISEADTNLNLGRALLLSDHPQRALPLLQRAVAVVHANHPKSPALASHRAWLGLCCLALGDTAQARALADLAQGALDAEPSAGIHYRRSLALLSEKLAAEPERG